MNIQGNKITVNKSKAELATYLTTMENFGALMPEGTKFEVLDSETFLFALKGMPDIKLRLQEKTTDKIVLGAAGGKMPFTLTAILNEIEANKTEAQLTFDGQFNAMMAMMIKGPITKFVGQLTDKLSTS